MSLRPSKKAAAPKQKVTEDDASSPRSPQSSPHSSSVGPALATGNSGSSTGWLRVALLSVFATIVVQALLLKLLGGTVHIPLLESPQQVPRVLEKADSLLTTAKLFESPPLSEEKPDPALSAAHKEVATSSAASWEKRDVKFHNNYAEAIDLLWVNNDGAESKMESIPAGETRPYSSYKNHVWAFRRSRDQVLLRSVVIADTSLIKVQLDGASKFSEEYEKRTGRPWLNVYPRDPAIFPIFDPVRVGHQFTVPTSAGFVTEADANPKGPGPTFTITTLSVSPKVFSVPGFLSEYECEYIKESAIKSNRLKRSGVTTDYTIHPSRTSSSVFLDYDATSAVFTQISRRGFEVLGIPGIPENYTKVAENLQVIHYGHTQEYSPHHDYFDPFMQVHLKDPAIQRGANRFATLLFYLNDVEEGGETVFPMKDGEYTAQPCERGFRVRPKKGDAVLFYSMLSDGNLDDRSLHGGCPVKKGEKWAANWWFWDPYRRG